jgi:DNA-binding HxlR family transcriptional regulator
LQRERHRNENDRVGALGTGHLGKQLAKSFDCATEFTLAVLNGKWKAVILSRLNEHPRRYSELRASIPGLSDKMLTQRLHDLMSWGLVEHRRSASHPTGCYELTPKGMLLDTLLRAICVWGQQHAGFFHVKIGEAAKVAAVRRKGR